jgi:ribosome maturation factor RimP
VPEQRTGDRQLTGRVVEADDERVVLETDAGPAAHPYAELGPGRVQVEFSRLDELADDEADDDIDDIDDEDDVEDEER